MAPVPLDAGPLGAHGEMVNHLGEDEVETRWKLGWK